MEIYVHVHGDVQVHVNFYRIVEKYPDNSHLTITGLLNLSFYTLFFYSQEEQRAKAKQAREDLRSFLENHKKMHSSVRWRRAGEIFQGEPVWEAVHERDRKDVFEDVVFFLAKKEKEEEKEQRAHNRKLMLTVYSTMPTITYRTTWAEVSLLYRAVFVYAGFS